MNNKYLTPDAILFDMDGVLVDSLHSWWKSLNEALKNYGEGEITRKEFIEKYWGNELQENLKTLGVNKKVGVFCNNIYKNYLDEIKLFRGTKKTLKKLDPYPKAIITNTPRECAIQILKKFKIKKFFKVIITSDQIENGKPAPDMIYKACEKLRVKPKKVILIGDTKNDIKAADAAGCKTIGINVEGDYKINKITELTKILKIN